MRRKAAHWMFAALLAMALAAINALAAQYDVTHPDQLAVIAFLCLMAMLMSLPEARIERGRFTLNGIVLGAAAILTNPLDATLIGLLSSVGLARRGPWPLLANAVTAATASCVGSIAASQLRMGDRLLVTSRLLVVFVTFMVSFILVAVALSMQLGESPLKTIRQNFTPSFYLAWGYFGLSALLLSYVLDGSLLGYLLATIVGVLALALTDTIAGRRVRRVLESELSDADRHLFHSRAVEGVVHNLRNHIATALGYLREIDLRRLDPVDRESIETATLAANDAVTVLNSLSQGATPRVSYATDPVDLNELVNRSVGMARPRARAKAVQLAVRESPDDVKVRADPLLLREVITNLLNNAIDAAPQGGHVEATTGRRGNGWPYLSVADDGVGVSDDHRHRLFEPHFSTKEGGTGLGLFMSYGIVREHRGELVYEGNRRGAIFTVVLPPFSS
jgi:signal transduction histidine kinase